MIINIGKYIEIAIDWITKNFTSFFDGIDHIVGNFINGFQYGLNWIPFYITIAIIALLAFYKAGKRCR